MKPISYKGYTFHVTVAVCHYDTQEIIDEFDNVSEAKANIKEIGHGGVWYLAAEEIDVNGNINPATWGKTYKEALVRLKKSL